MRETDVVTDLAVARLRKLTRRRAMMPIQQLSDGHLWFDEYGPDDASEIVLSSAMAFAKHAYPERLAEDPTRYKVFTIQARGFGRSTRLSQPPDEGWLTRWADDVVAFADSKGIDRFIYTGASHGAGIGWYLAVRHAERLKAFVSVVGTPHDRNGVTDSSEGRRKVIQARFENDRAQLREQFAELAGYLYPDEVARHERRERTIDRAVEAQMALDDDEARINQGMPFPEAKSNEELAKVLRTVRVPVLILAGMRDGVVSPESSLRGVTNVRDSKAVFFESEGHYMTREIPERLVREVKVFVDELNETAPSEESSLCTDAEGVVTV